MLHCETLPESTLDLLTELCVHPACAPFALAGGTALALRFGHRRSIDLDFFTPTDFDSARLAQLLATDFGFVPRSIHENALAGEIGGARVDFVAYRHPMLQPVEVIERVRLFSLRDNIAMKLSAVTNRGAKKDFFDVHELLKVVGINELVAIYQAKFPGHDAAIVLRSLCYFDDAEADFDPESLDGTTWPQVKAAIAKAVRDFV